MTDTHLTNTHTYTHVQVRNVIAAASRFARTYREGNHSTSLGSPNGSSHRERGSPHTPHTGGHSGLYTGQVGFTSPNASNSTNNHTHTHFSHLLESPSGIPGLLSESDDTSYTAPPGESAELDRLAAKLLQVCLCVYVLYLRGAIPPGG